MPEPAPYLDDGDVRLILGDCVAVMAGLEAESVDAVVTDPPYGLGFMGREWDRPGMHSRTEAQVNSILPAGGQAAHFWEPHPFQEWCHAWATQALRVLRPGGHLLAFGGTRTFHRLTCAVEDAGFEVRDCLSWLYGSGFPKSLDVSKAIDKANGRRFEDRYALGRHIRERREAKGLTQPEVNAWFGYRDGCQHWERQDPSGARVPTLADWRVLNERLELSDEFLPLIEREEAEREVVGTRAQRAATPNGGAAMNFSAGEVEPITAPATPEAAAWQGWGTALKPAWEPIILARKPLAGTVAANVLATGCGAINVDGCKLAPAAPSTTPGEVGGRWPANVVLSHTPECREVGTRKVKGISGGTGNHDGKVYGARSNQGEKVRDYTDADGTETVAAWECSPDCPVRLLDEGVGERPSGSRAAGEYGRLGYQGWESGPMPAVSGDTGGPSRFFYTAKASSAERDGATHPTVKPLALMRWLVRLVTPPGGLVLDPFAGSGTTGLACRAEGMRALLIEREAEYAAMAAHRLRQLSLLGDVHA